MRERRRRRRQKGEVLGGREGEVREGGGEGVREVTGQRITPEGKGYINQERQHEGNGT